MRVGLVLGAGGVLGGAWLTGALHALATETGWDPASADHIVGTSAGSMIGRAGGGRRAAVVHGRPLGAARPSRAWPAPTAGRRRRPTARPERCSGSTAGCRRSGRARCGWRSRRSRPRRATRRWRSRSDGCRAGSSPPSRWSATIRRVVPSGWVDHDAFWAVACDYADRQAGGLRARGLAAGRDGQGRGRLVRHPGLLPPGAHRLGALRGRRRALGLQPRPARRAGPRPRDLPQPHLHAARAARARGSLDRVGACHAGGRGPAARATRPSGCAPAAPRSSCIQPVAEDLAVMGPNLMSGRRRHEVIETAVRHRHRGALASPSSATRLRALPQGEPHKIRRPAGDPSDVARVPARPPAGAPPDAAHRLRRRASAFRCETARGDAQGPRRAARSAPSRNGAARARTANGRSRRRRSGPDRARPPRVARALERRSPARPRRACPRRTSTSATPTTSAESLPGMWLLASLWFRGEVRGLERIPADGPVLLVGNHSGGNLTPDTTVFTLAFNTYFGVERRFYQLAHNLVLSMPGLGFLRKYGTVAASPSERRQGADSRRRAARLPGRGLRGAPAQLGAREGRLRRAQGLHPARAGEGRADRAGGLGRRPGDGAVPQPRRVAGQAAGPRPMFRLKVLPISLAHPVGTQRRRHARPRARCRPRSRSRCSSRSTCASATGTNPTWTRSTPT